MLIDESTVGRLLTNFKKLEVSIIENEMVDPRTAADEVIATTVLTNIQ